MRVDPARAAQLVANLSGVRAKVQAAAAEKSVRLVAVSKLKPASDVLALHEAPTLRHLHFGENYLQELTEKARVLPSTVRWHFIGALQTNKCGRLAQIPNLFVVSGVDAPKKADALNKGRGQLIADRGEQTGDVDAVPDRDEDDRLGVHVQVNTSGEESKSGVAPDETAALCEHILDSCPHLRLRGLMTIGALARSQAVSSSGSAKPATAATTTTTSSGGGSSTPDASRADEQGGPSDATGRGETDADEGNPDFTTLRQTRDAVANRLGMPPAALELSMGMSQDYEHAVRAGSDEVRVGSTIFGERPARKDAVM